MDPDDRGKGSKSNSNSKSKSKSKSKSFLRDNDLLSGKSSLYENESGGGLASLIGRENRVRPI